MNEENKTMLKIGAKAPDWQADAYHNDEEKKIKLSDYQGKWLVMMFYPADFTFVCPTELGDMADHYQELQKINTEVVSISTDKVFTHKAWHNESDTIKKIQFPMLADPTGQISRTYNVLIEEVGEALRGTFIISPDGILKSYEINDNSIGRSSKELMRKIKAAQFVAEHGDQVCPANWEPGEATLKPGLDLVGKI